MSLKNFYFNSRLMAAVAVFSFLVPVRSALAVELSIKNELRASEANSVLLVEDARSIESPKSRFTTSIPRSAHPERAFTAALNLRSGEAIC